MKRFLKCSIILGLLCALLGTTVAAGNSMYVAYKFQNTGRNWVSTYSYNKKATTGAKWFIKVGNVSFGGGNTAGTLGIAHVPMPESSSVQAANIHWTLTPDSYYKYYTWFSGYGGAGERYMLKVRLDDLIHPISAAISEGLWNSN